MRRLVSQITICDAIKTRNIIQFYYAPGKDPGFRTVEPHIPSLLALSIEQSLSVSRVLALSDVVEEYDAAMCAFPDRLSLRTSHEIGRAHV